MYPPSVLSELLRRERGEGDDQRSQPQVELPLHPPPPPEHEPEQRPESSDPNSPEPPRGVTIIPLWD